MLFFRLLSCSVILLSLSPARASFKYIDSSCSSNQAALANGATESFSAVTAAINAMKGTSLPSRVANMLLAVLGSTANPATDDAVLVASLTGAYTTLQGALGLIPNNVYVYCGDSLGWSTFQPDTSQADCGKTFNPTTNPPACAVPCAPTANGGRGGYWWVPNPVPNGDTWVPVAGVDNAYNTPSGQSFCSSTTQQAATLRSADMNAKGVAAIIVFCPSAFAPPSQYTTSNANNEYWKTPNDVGARLAAHKGTLASIIIHELGHAGACADDQLVNGQKAYEWSGVVALAQQNAGRSAADNNAWRNCDTQALFALAMLMDKCDWSDNLARQPSTP